MSKDFDIDTFGAIIDKHLKKNEIKMLIEIPEGTMEPEITSSFGIATMDLYILLHAMRKTLAQVMIDGNVDPDNKGEMISAMIDMIKADLINEEAADGGVD